MKKVMKKSLSVIMIVVLCLTMAPLQGFVGAELIKSKAAYVEETLDEKNNLYQTYYVDKHIEFINSDHYHNMKNYERWAYYLEEAASSTVKDIAAGVQDMLNVADSLINLDFNGIPVASNAYTTVVTSLFADADTSNIFTEFYEKYIDLESVGFFTKLKKLCQDSGKWSNSVNFDVEIQHLWNLNISDYESNSFCVFITDCLESQGVSKMQSIGLFADIEAYSEISGCIGSVSSLIDALVRWGKYEAAIKAFRNTSSEFKIVFSSLKGSGNAWLDNAVNTYLSCLDDDYASDYLKTKIVVDGVLTAINVGNDLFKPFITKGAAKLYGVEVSVAAACIFAFDFGFKLSNAITGNDAIVECKRLLRANSELEKRMYTVLTSYENKLLSTNSYNNAKLYDVAYNMYRNVQIFSLNSYSSMLDKQKDTVLNRILCWTKLRDVSDYEHEIKFCAENIALWQSSICHDPDVLITSDYLEINSNHMYTVACPTDVVVADSKGNKLVEIVADKLLHLDERCVAIVVDSIKVIVIPSSIECIIKITGTDQGKMDYTIDEYNEGSVVRSLKYKDVPLEKGSEYIATVPDKIMQNSESYTLEDNNKNPVELYSDSLPPVEDNVVDVIVAEELFDGFPVEVIDLVADTMFNMKSVVDLSAYDISTDDAVALFSAVAKYYPVEYSLMSKSDFTYKIIVSPNLDRIMKIRFYYGDDANLSTYQKRVNDLKTEIDALVEKVKGMDDFEKALYIHDYIVLNSEYDLELLEYMESNNFILPGELYSEKYSEYSILVNGTGVCGSYALAYRAVLNAAGMECLYLSSAQMNHAWNMVKIDGNWYHVDCCWDDPTPDTYGKARRTYFLRTDDEIMKLNHYSWTPGQYKANSDKYSDMPRSYDIKQKYDDGKWYYLTGSTLFSSDKYGKNETEITSISASSIDADNGNVYYSTGRYVYEYDIEENERNLVYMLSNKDSGDKLSQAYLSNIYVNGENVEFYKSIYNDDKRITAYDTDSLQRDKFSSVTGIEISQSEVELNIFETLKLNATILSEGDTKGLDIVWESSDETIAVVNNGQVTGRNVGKVIVTAYIGYIKASCSVNVVGDGLSGMCTDNIIWSFDVKQEILSLSGTGEMPRYQYASNAPWYKLREKIKTVIIGDGITNIGMYAFTKYENLLEVNVANTVTSIDSYAFEYCYSLKNVVFGENSELKIIGSAAFLECTALLNITIPDGVTSIYDNAFHDCDSLESIVIPKSFTTYGAFMFSSCDSLKSITVDVKNANYSSVDGVLYNKDQTSLICYPAGKTDVTFSVPENVTNIFGFAFNGCMFLEHISISDSVTRIYFMAFYQCNSLKCIILPDSITSIESYAFYDCDSLTNIVIPNGVTSIGQNAFYDCDSLMCVTIPDSVENIGAYAFYDCDSLENLIIPDNVFSIESHAVSATELKKILVKNPNCVFNDSYSIDKKTTIYGYSNSTAQNYAENTGCKFIAIDTIPHVHDCFLMEYQFATETKDGYKYYECYCGESNYTTILHYYSEETTEEPICTVDGIKSKTCLNCGEVEIIETTPATGKHDYKLVSTVSGTCTTAPVNTYECTVCGDTYTKDGKIDDGHNYVETVVKPTCDKKGYTTATCSDCGETVIYDYTSPKGHEFIINHPEGYCSAHNTLEYSCKSCDYSECIAADTENLVTETVTVEPTCTKSGTKSEICTLCGATVSVEILNPLSHEYAEDYTVDVEATCTTNGSKSQHCIRCNAKRAVTAIEATGHQSTSLINAAEATCIKNGYTGDTYCDDCKTVIVTGESTAKLSHNYNSVITAPTCTSKGFTIHTCTACGDNYTDGETKPIDHSYSSVVTPATCTSNGYTTHTCIVCSHSYTSDTVSSTGHKYNDNGICVGCSKNRTENCSHMCHKSGFMGFIWKIVRFFWKLFKMNPVCECGVAHY